MKCPQCGVHYDDSEKECPMCGARRPAFGMDASRLAKTAGSLVQLEEPEKRKKRQRRKTDSEAHPTALNGKPYKPKKKWGPVKIILLVIILVNFLPMLLGLLFGIAEEVIWKVEDTVSDWGADEWNEPLPDSPEPMYDDCPAAGVWLGAAEPFQLTLGQEQAEEYGVPRYEVATEDGYSERGVYWYQYYPEEEDFPYPDQYPAEQYDWYMICFEPQEMTGGEDSPELDAYFTQGGYVELFLSKDNEMQAYLWNLESVPWMEDGQEISLLQIAGGADADTLLAPAQTA